ncbi:nuclear transport factor 2 family protein [Streptomyces sp. NPDC051217]|uniref:nuclear transport factor 2 family protein n=1 Tax=Streptomyces sp. NPDC051217 TaxID=3365644 RepID=UPI0037B9CDCB
MAETITRHADRLAIRELVDAWARCADRRLPDQQAALFTPDGTVTVHRRAVDGIQLGKDSFNAVAAKVAQTARDQEQWREIALLVERGYLREPSGSA